MEELLEKVFGAACEEFGLNPARINANVFFVSKSEIRAANREHRNIDRATDVLSFPMLNLNEGKLDLKNFDEVYKNDINRETNKLDLGDILICCSVAKSQARLYGHSEEREIAFLYLHGLLHLLGFDHINEADEIKMRAAQTQILESIGQGV
ncbi:MAG: rRNA maturation RNase YbeY [Christensenellaceae bacterium]|jgi:probable rRNA maturation factor|nr:rRNA maturation RNase YbeY [Christensenellaceae bacterium]